MPRYRVRRHRWFRISDDVDVEADDEDAAHDAAKALYDEPELDQLEQDDFQTDSIDLIGEFGLRFFSGNRVIAVTQLLYETRTEAYEFGQAVWALGLPGLGEVRPEWLVPEIRNPEITWIEVVSGSGERWTVLHYPDTPKFTEPSAA